MKLAVESEASEFRAGTERYLAVSLAFNGHNNEAGGAARIEGFKQLIRFRINRDGLTGFVIAIDKPNTIGGKGHLEPRLVDVFKVHP